MMAVREIIEKVIEEWFPEEKPAKKEVTPKEREELKAELEKQKEKVPPIPPSVQKKVSKKAATLKKVPVPRKIKSLLILCKKEGLVYAIEVAKATGDPYLIDIFHDILAKDGFYKNFLK